MPWLWELLPDDRRYYPCYAEWVAKVVPVCRLAGPTGPLKPSGPGRPIPHLTNGLREFADRTVVAVHIDHPWTESLS